MAREENASDLREPHLSGWRERAQSKLGRDCEGRISKKMKALEEGLGIGDTIMDLLRNCGDVVVT